MVKYFSLYHPTFFIQTLYSILINNTTVKKNTRVKIHLIIILDIRECKK